MKSTLFLVLLFLICNILGSLISPIMYILALKYEIVDITGSSFNAAAMQQDFMMKVPLTWITCFLFSFSAFFITGLWRKLFLLFPIIIPLIYGLILLNGHTI